MNAIRKLIQIAAKSKLNVLIMGETGTGKELAARMIHDHSPRADNPYVIVNCAAIPSELFESQLFGHEKGAFTGASQSRTGLFEEAHGGTLFLDEIGELRPEQQASLLRAVENGTFKKVGGREIVADVRVIAATNRPYAGSADDNSLRSDLYHRLSGFEIDMPKLSDHTEDIPFLVQHFLVQDRILNKTSAKTIDYDAIQLLQEWHWPGNVRELRACIERAAVFAQEGRILAKDILIRKSNSDTSQDDLSAGLTLAEAEKRHIINTLQAHTHNVRAASRALGCARNTLYRKMEEYGIRD